MELWTAFILGLLGIYVTVPPLDDHYLARIPTSARDFHRSYVDRLDSSWPSGDGRRPA